MAVGGGAAESAIVPMEDTVQALMEHLVAPLLPARDSMHSPPTIDQQTAVGKQMFSVVLLCNYYHRKQFPELKFLDFEPFCKVACNAKPSLRMYMKYMNKYMEAGNLDKQLSITEKMIMDACNTSSILDALESISDIDGWPISRVAVFLVDPKRVNCYLEFGSITQGVWSLVENELNKPIKNVIGVTTALKHTWRSKRAASDELLKNDEVLQQLAFSAVEQKTGITRSKFQILDYHMAYSLSPDKTITRLYIMESTESVNEGLMEFTIKDVFSSLKGPLVRSGISPEVTSVVEYYHVLPYLNALSNWFSREVPHEASLNSLMTNSLVDKECSFDSDIVPTHQDHGINKSYDQCKRAVPISCESVSMSINEATQEKEFYLTSGEDTTRAACGQPADAISSPLQLDRLPTAKNQTIKWQSTVNENKNKACAGGLTSLAIKPYATETKDGELFALTDEATNKKESNIYSGEDSAGAACGPQAKAVSSPLTLDRLPTAEKQAMICQSTVEEDKNKLSSTEVITRVAKKPRMTESKDGEPSSLIIGEATTKKETNLPSEEYSARAACRQQGHATSSPLELDRLCITQNQTTKCNSTITENNCKKACSGIITSLAKNPHMLNKKCGEPFGIRDINRTVGDAVRPSDFSLVAVKSQSESDYDFHLAMASKKDDLQATLRVLQRRRDELSEQQRQFEDEIARCEMNIQAILSDLEGNRQHKVESFFEAFDDLYSSRMHIGTCHCYVARSQRQDTKSKRLSEAVFATKDSCQELDDVCCQNCWISPRYTVLPSYDNGNFQAAITVKGMDFESIVCSDLKSSPCEARSSAASNMLSELRRMQANHKN